VDFITVGRVSFDDSVAAGNSLPRLLSLRQADKRRAFILDGKSAFMQKPDAS
jgi:hypothetical protein